MNFAILAVFSGVLKLIRSHSQARKIINSCGENWSGATPPANPLTNYKNQWDYTFSAGVQYDITKSLSLDLAYSAILGRNAQDRADLALASGSQLPALKRQFDDQTVSMGAKYKF